MSATPATFASSAWLGFSLVLASCSPGGREAERGDAPPQVAEGSPPAAFAGDYRIQGSEPGGEPYQGEATISAEGKHWRMDWIVEGAPPASGPVLWHDGTFASAYGSEDYTGMALYTWEDGRLRGRFTAPEMDGMVGRQELIPEGGGFPGPFRDGDEVSPGKVTFAEEEGRYRVTWDMGGQVYQGLGLRLGDQVAVVYGKSPDSLLSIALHRLENGAWTGAWAISYEGGTGEVSLTPADGQAAHPPDDHQFLLLGGEVYQLKGGGSQPGEAISELREYRRLGDDPASAAKLLTVSRHHPAAGQADAYLAEMMQALAEAQPEGYEGATLDASAEAATGLVLLQDGDEAAVNALHVRRDGSAMSVVQMQMRRAPPYDSEDAFMQEQALRMERWAADVGMLADKASSLLEATRGAR